MFFQPIKLQTTTIFLSTPSEGGCSTVITTPFYCSSDMKRRSICCQTLLLMSRFSLLSFDRIIEGSKGFHSEQRSDITAKRYCLNTTSPPSTVITTCVSMIFRTSEEASEEPNSTTSRSSTTKSASFPTSIEPLISSSKFA